MHAFEASEQAAAQILRSCGASSDSNGFKTVLHAIKLLLHKECSVNALHELEKNYEPRVLLMLEMQVFTQSATLMFSKPLHCKPSCKLLRATHSETVLQAVNKARA